jgi:type I restriction enzyme S subunit
MRDGWVETPIGDIAQVLSGFAFKSELFNKTEGIPLIRIRDLPKRDSTEALYSGSYEDRYVVKKGDFLIGMDGEFHCYEWNGPDALLNQRVCRIQDFKLAIVIPRYIYFAVNQYLDKIEQDTGYTTVKHISAKQVLGITIPLPPLPEQKRIVDLFSAVDSYIESLQQQLESAKRSRNAVLHELLTAGGNDWVETTLGQEFEICKNGKNYKDGISTEGLPITRIQTIADGKIDLTKVGFGNLFAEDAEGFLLEEGDILFSHINSLPHLGKVARVQNSHLPLIHGMNLLRMRFRNSNDPNFMFYLMQSESMRNEIKSRAQVAVNQVSINISSIKTVKIVIPQLKTQRELASLIGALDNFIEECENNLGSARNLRTGLLSDLLSGAHEIPSSYDKVMGAA